MKQLLGSVVLTNDLTACFNEIMGDFPHKHPFPRCEPLKEPPFHLCQFHLDPYSELGSGCVPFDSVQPHRCDHSCAFVDLQRLCLCMLYPREQFVITGLPGNEQGMTGEAE